MSRNESGGHRVWTPETPPPEVKRQLRQVPQTIDPWWCRGILAGFGVIEYESPDGTRWAKVRVARMEIVPDVRRKALAGMPVRIRTRKRRRLQTVWYRLIADTTKRQRRRKRA